MKCIEIQSILQRQRNEKAFSLSLWPLFREIGDLKNDTMHDEKMRRQNRIERETEEGMRMRRREGGRERKR